MCNIKRVTLAFRSPGPAELQTADVATLLRRFFSEPRQYASNIQFITKAYRYSKFKKNYVTHRIKKFGARRGVAGSSARYAQITCERESIRRGTALRAASCKGAGGERRGCREWKVEGSTARRGGARREGGRDGAPRRRARLIDSAATSPQSGCCRCVE